LVEAQQRAEVIRILIEDDLDARSKLLLFWMFVPRQKGQIRERRGSAALCYRDNRRLRDIPWGSRCQRWAKTDLLNDRTSSLSICELERRHHFRSNLAPNARFAVLGVDEGMAVIILIVSNLLWTVSFGLFLAGALVYAVNSHLGRELLKQSLTVFAMVLLLRTVFL